jgi:hypothetical protein
MTGEFSRRDPLSTGRGRRHGDERNLPTSLRLTVSDESGLPAQYKEATLAAAFEHHRQFKLDTLRNGRWARIVSAN